MRSIGDGARVSNWTEEFTNSNCDADVDDLPSRSLPIIGIDRSRCAATLVGEGPLVPSLAYQSGAWLKGSPNSVMNCAVITSVSLQTGRILIYSFSYSFLWSKRQTY